MKTFNCLSSDHFPQNKLFLEASAGTGKTFAIENLFVRLILGYDQEPAPVESILVVTFTKAATRELKSRIELALQRAHEYLVSQKGEAPAYLRAYESEQERELWQLRLRSAIDAIDTLQIYTIHSFCHRMLQDHAFTTGEWIATDEESASDPREYIIDALRSLSHSEMHPIEMKLILRAEKGDFSALVEKILRYVHVDIQYKPGMSYRDVLARLESQIKALPPFDKCDLEEDLFALIEGYQKVQNRQKELHPHFQKQLHILITWLVKRTIHHTELEELMLDKDFLFELMTEANAKKKRVVPELKCRDVVRALRENIAPLISELRNAKERFLRLLSLIGPVLVEKMHSDVGAFPDVLLHKMQSLLEHQGFVSAIRKQFSSAIVDEFQDTDPLQWSIFRSLFLLGHNQLKLLALIGDPKQSIYRFRRADIATYQRAKLEMGMDSHFRLSTNYRSDPELIHALNLWWGDSPELFEFTEQSSKLAYSHVEAGKESRLQGSVPTFTIGMIVNEGSSRENFPSRDTEAKGIFPHMIREIVRLNQEGMPLSRIAVLVKDRYQALRVKEALLNSRIHAYTARGESIASADAYHFVGSLLRALENPYDENRMMVLLSHRFFHFAHHGLDEEEHRALWQERFIAMKQLTYEKSFAATINRFHGYDDHLFLRHLIADHEFDEYSDYQRIIGYLLSAVKGRSGSLTTLIRSYEAIKRKNPDLHPEVRKSRLDNEECVQILTTHMSKGLEYDAVFVVGLSHRSRIKKEYIVDSKSQQLTLASQNEMHAMRDVMEEDSEKLRQLYVALTRAKTVLTVYAVFDVAPVRTAAWSPLELFLLKRFFGVNTHAKLEQYRDQLTLESMSNHLTQLSRESCLQCDLLDLNLSVEPLPPTQPVELHMPQRPDVKYKATKRLSFSQLAKHSNEGKMSLDQEEKQQATPFFPAGPVVGEVIHSLFEHILSAGLHYPLNEEAIHSLVERMIFSTPLQDHLSETIEMIRLGLEAQFADGFSLKDVPNTQMLEEVDFLFSVDDRHQMVGMMDLIFTYQNKLYLLDWKTNFLGNRAEDYSHHAIAHAMQESRYDLQASIYADALVRSQGWHGLEFASSIYVFLRGLPHGKGVYEFVPDRSYVEREVQQMRRP